jgi:hypothetical protein
MCTTESSPEQKTAKALFELAEKVALSDEKDSYWESKRLYRRAEEMAAIEISARDDEYTKQKEIIDDAIKDLNSNLKSLDDKRILLSQVRKVVALIDTFLGAVAGYFI